MRHEHHEMTQEEKDQIAQEKFNKPYDQCDTHEKRSVGGTYRWASRARCIPAGQPLGTPVLG